MFNSFLGGTKSAVEMAAVANATGLDAPEAGLAFLPGGVDDLPNILRPIADGGALERSGMLEAVSCVDRDVRAVSKDLRWGVFVPFGLVRRPRPRLGVSIASVALRGETTGAAHDFRADVAAVAKRDLAAGETLDGEGGYTANSCQPARRLHATRFRSVLPMDGVWPGPCQPVKPCVGKIARLTRATRRFVGGVRWS
jgi:predicted homoserine dehydrogenase-like protein